MDYKNGKIYKLQCDDGHFYIGSTTTELRKRLCDHKKRAKKDIERLVYKTLNEIGWDKVRIVLIEDYPCENKQELTGKEDEHIRTHKTDPLCLNSRVNNTTCEERKEQQQKSEMNRKEQKKEYRKANAERLSQYAKDYVEKNKEKVTEYRREYKQANRERANQRQRERRARVKE